MSKFHWGMKACGVFLLWAGAAVGLPAQTFTSLHNFGGMDGAEPFAALVQAADGNFYGTTTSDGANGSGGTFFKVTPGGVLTTLYSFCSQSNCADGYSPQGSLVQSANGDYYGITFNGGTGSSCFLEGCGTIFKITRTGALTTLYSFCSQGNCAGGYGPTAGLIRATDGNFYGTTAYGGTSDDGTVFKITQGGALTTLHSFNGPDGSIPYAGLIQATDGNLYGTTTYGGANDDGTVFKITPSGRLTTLHSFDMTDGACPKGLVQATNGILYGTTLNGGRDFDGTIFKINPSGRLTTLHNFDNADGAAPAAALIQGSDGNLYGTAYDGGANDDGGTVFRITPGGALTTLYSFCSRSNCTDGEYPETPLVQETDGRFYGTTYQGGSNNDGTIFSLSVGLGPFVKTQPASGHVGVAVNILGPNLTGATSVTFNDAPATFTVKSKSQITTTVPAGATTGTVQVVTPKGALSSNVPFRVLP